MNYRNIGYSVFGGGGAAGSMLANPNCLGGCNACFGCVAFAGLLVSLALVKTICGTKEDKDGLAERDN